MFGKSFGMLILSIAQKVVSVDPNLERRVTFDRKKRSLKTIETEKTRQLSEETSKIRKKFRIGID